MPGKRVQLANGWAWRTPRWEPCALVARARVCAGGSWQQLSLPRQSTGGRRTITVESVRFVTADVALADGRYEINGMAGGQSRHMWSTFVITRGTDGWRIAGIRNMLPAPPAGR